MLRRKTYYFFDVGSKKVFQSKNSYFGRFWRLKSYDIHQLFLWPVKKSRTSTRKLNSEEKIDIKVYRPTVVCM